jgi:hypothetical protein
MSYGVGLAAGSGPAQSNGVDIEVNAKTYPGFILNPVSAEPNGAYCVPGREINGSLWYMVNADISTSGLFIQINAAAASYAFVLLQGGGYAYYTAPAGSATGFAWTLLFSVSATGLVTKGFPLFFSSTSVSSTISNTVAETFFNQPVYTIPAGALNVLGTILRLRIGYIFNNASTTPTLRLRVYLGGILIGDTLAIATPSVSSGVVVTWQQDLHVTLIGASGAFQGGFAASSLAGNLLGAQPSPTGLNLATALPLTFSAQWGTASASDQVQMTSLGVEILAPNSTG